jgi:hypothetical protein
MKCRVCGCTDLEPCISAGGETCAWIDADLCDFCEDGELDPVVGLYTEGDLNQVIAARRRA